MRLATCAAKASLFVLMCLALLAVQGADLATLSGRVTLDRGQPLAGVTLCFSGDVPPVVTGADGRFRVAVPPGIEVTVTPEKSGYGFTPAARRVWTSAGVVTADFRARNVTPAGRVAQPDLRHMSLSADTGALWGGTVQVNASLANDGAEDAGAFHIQWRLSRDTVLSDDDVLLRLAAGGEALYQPPIPAGMGGRAVSARLTLPATKPAGWPDTLMFYLIMVIDSAGEVAESNETNNAANVLLVVTDGPDLQGSFLAAPASAFWDGNITIRAKVKNAGAENAGAFHVEWELAKDADATSGAHLSPPNYPGGLYYQSHPALAAGAEGEEISVTLHIPEHLGDLSGPWADGQYFLIMRTDCNLEVRETKEGNNSGQMGEGLDRATLTLTQAPDLTGRPTFSETSAFWGGPAQVTTWMTNGGNVDAGAFHVEWYLSQDSTLSADDILLSLKEGGTSYSHPAIPAEFTAEPFRVTLKLPLTPPAWWIAGHGPVVIMKVDSADEVAECNEANNIWSMGSLSVSHGPDLQGAGLRPPASAYWGNTLRVPTTIRNAGAAGAYGFKVQWYLAQDEAGTGWTPLPISDSSNQHWYAGLAAGQTGAEFSVDLMLPRTPPAGWTGNQFFLILYTDALNDVKEVDEENNSGQMGVGLDRATITLSQAPNLVPGYQTLPRDVGWAGVVDFTATARNTGMVDSGAFDIHWRLSRDAVYSADDLPLPLADGASAYRHVSLGAEGYGVPFNVSLQLPPGLPAGWSGTSFYILMKVDSGDEVAETNEADNAFGTAALFLNKPDLQGVSFQAPTTARWGSSVSVQGQIRNAGTAASGEFAVAWYLAKDSSGTDAMLLIRSGSTGAYLWHAGLAAGTTGPAFATTVDLPAARPSGWTGTQLYLLMKSDVGGQVNESSEHNNFGERGDGRDRRRIILGDAADLRGVKCVAPAAASWGSAVTVQAQVRNAGLAPAGAFRVEWYLAQASTGAGAILLSRTAGLGTSLARSGIAAATTAPAFTVYLQLPAALPAGWSGTQFVLLMKTDSGDQVAESNEANNFGQIGDGRDRWPIALTAPDLMGAKCEGPTAAVWGSAVTLRCQVRNGGNGAAGAFQVEWCLSPNSKGSQPVLLNRADIKGTAYSHAGLAVGATGPEFSVRLSLPARAPEGWLSTTGFIFMRTDSAGKVAESNETNNFASMGLGKDFCSFRLASGPDLQGALCTVTPSALWGRSISIRAQIRNAGSLNAGAFAVQWYLSRDAVGSLDDVLLSSKTGSSYAHPLLAAGASGPVFPMTLLLPSALPTGWTGTRFYLVMKTDTTGAVREVYETNNFGQMGVGKDAAPITIGVLPDLQGCRLEPTPSARWGATIQVRAQVRNAAAAPAGAFNVSWCLAPSADPAAARVQIRLSSGTLYYAHPALAASSTGASFVVNLALPAAPPTGWPQGSAYLIMRTDSGGVVAEANENNNFGQVGTGKDRAPITFGVQPDLVGAACTPPEAAVWGETITVQARAANLGAGASDRFRIQWYLSRDTLGSGDDVALALADGTGTYTSHGGLGAGSVGALFTVALDLPAAPPAGWTGTGFYLLMKTDAANQVVESNEANNFGQRGDGYDRAPLTLGDAAADLKGVECVSPGTGTWGGSVPLTCRVQNAGTAGTGQFLVQWYLSTDATGSSDDVLLSLVDGMGSYYLHPTLAAGASGLEFTIELQLPPEAPAGVVGTRYYVIMNCDPLNEVEESNEANNFGQVGDDIDRTAVTITSPLPDLHGAYFDAPATVYWGSVFRATARIANDGSGAAGRFRIQWYLSRDSLGSSDDIPLPMVGGMGYLSHPGIGALSEGDDFPVDLQLPDALPAGWSGTSFKVIMRIDSADQVSEADEFNNFAQALFGHGYDTVTVQALQPDLLGYGLTTPTTATWGDVLRVQARVRNAGTGDAGRFRVRWYLSRDTAGSADDVLLSLADGMGGYYSHAGIAAAASGGYFPVDLQLPDTIPDGWSGTSFTLIMKVDADAQVAEANEGNNFGQAGAGLDRAAITVR